MNTINPQLHKSIMRRVYAVWFLKRITSPAMVRLYAVVALFVQLLRNISVTNVLENMSGIDVVGGVLYVAQAFTETELAVQLYLSLFTVVALWMLFEYAKKVLFEQHSL